MTDVTEDINISPGSWLRLEEVMRHEVHPRGQFGREPSGTLLDCMFVVLND